MFCTQKLFCSVIVILNLIFTNIAPAVASDPTILDGSGSVMAIIDTGIDASLAQFKGKIVGEACFSSNLSCPNGTNEQVGTGAATLSTAVASGAGLNHGTAMASVALQVAPGAKIFMIRDASINVAGQMSLSIGDLNRAISWVAKNAKSFGITSLSISQGSSTMNCTNTIKSQTNLDFDSLFKQGIPTFAATGNAGSTGRIDWPACAPAAISVGGLDKKAGSQVLPFEPGLIASSSNVTDDTDIYSLVSWKTAIPGGAYSITSGTSNSAASMNGYWSLVRQAKPTATAIEIWNAIMASANSIDSIRAKNVRGINTAAAAQKLIGASVQLVDGTPNFPVNSNIGLTETAVTGADSAPVISFVGGGVQDATKAYPGGWFKYSATVTDDIAIGGVKVFITGADSIKRLIYTPIPTAASPKKLTLDEYLVLDWSLPLGQYKITIEVSDANNQIAVDGGFVTLKETPADRSRPILSANTYIAAQSTKAPLLSGAKVRIFLNGADDLRITECRYIVYDPTGARTEFKADLIASTLFYYRSCDAYWTVPVNAAGGSKYTIKAYASDGIGFGAETDYNVITVSKKIQTITFGVIPNTYYGSAVKLVATSSSGLPVDFISATPSICTIRKENGMAYVDGIKPASNINQNCIVNAVQAGDSAFEPAVMVQRAFTFSKPAAPIVFVDPKTVKASVNFPTPTKPALVIIDTAFDSSITALKDRVIYEVCIIDWASCPNGQKYMEGPGAALLQQPYISSNGFDHGTKMVSVAAAANPNINIVFIRIIGATATGVRQVAGESSFANALAWIKTNATALNIKAVSMSQGHHNLLNTALNYCPSTPLTKTLIVDLKNMQIPVFVAAGNNRDYVRIDWPACIQEAIAVGGVDTIGNPWSGSNFDPNLVDYMALSMGTVTASGGKTQNAQGTSISTPNAAAQYLQLLAAKPSLNSQQILDLMSTTAKTVKGTAYTTNKVLNILAALG